jgi:hypothetical protein
MRSKKFDRQLRPTDKCDDTAVAIELLARLSFNNSVKSIENICAPRQNQGMLTKKVFELTKSSAYSAKQYYEIRIDSIRFCGKLILAPSFGRN